MALVLTFSVRLAASSLMILLSASDIVRLTEGAGCRYWVFGTSVGEKCILPQRRKGSEERKGREIVARECTHEIAQAPKFKMLGEQ
jgi:hypothetical protein